MDIRIREGTPADGEICGRICYNAFKTISEAHGFAPDFPAPEMAIEVLTRLLANPKFYSVVAEIDGRIVGSNFLDERNSIAGVGPITVDPTVQNRTIGRRLMDAVHERAAEKDFAAVVKDAEVDVVVLAATEKLRPSPPTRDSCGTSTSGIRRASTTR